MRRSLSEIQQRTSDAVSRAGRVQPPGLTRRQKRLLVGGRLVEPDSDRLSDRAIARELGVSQPFVSSIRRRAGETHGRRHVHVAGGFDASPEPAGLALPGWNEHRPGSSSVECSRPTSAQQWLDRNHDECSPLGRVRRIAWPAAWDVSRADSDDDPFERR